MLRDMGTSDGRRNGGGRLYAWKVTGDGSQVQPRKEFDRLAIAASEPLAPARSAVRDANCGNRLPVTCLFSDLGQCLIHHVV